MADLAFTPLVMARDIDLGVPRPVSIHNQHVLVEGIVTLGGADVSDTNPLPVEVIGLATESPISVMQQPTITAGAYTAGDAIGGLLTFAGVARIAGGGGTITKVTIIDDAKVAAPIDIVFFDQTFAATADNAPFDPPDADMENCIGYVNVAATDYAQFNDNAVGGKTSGRQMPFDYDLAAGGTSLFAQMVVRSGPTYIATSDITVKIVVQRA